MQVEQLTYKNSLIRYYRFGSGPVPVICFHGYGEDASSFSILAEIPGNQYTFHAIELPYHGGTGWKEGLTFTLDDLQQVVGRASLPAAIQPILMGFSLGGRIALALYESQPALFRKIILLAPDGLIVNPWYWLATQTYAGNRFFRFTMKHPGWFFTLLKTLNRTGRVNASVFKFVNAYIGNPSLRLMLYQRWTVLRKIKPGLKHIKLLIRQHQTPVRLLYGKYDRIILPERGEAFRKGIEQYCTINILPAGHQLLQSKYLREIAEALHS